MKHIPLHSLVILIGLEKSGKSTLARKYFPDYEIINLEKIQIDILGTNNRHDLNHIIFKEIYHRIKIKLSLGERVIVDASNMKRRERIALANIGNNFGSPVFYIIANKLASNEATKYDKQILQGDGVAEVIDAKKEEFEVVSKLPTGNIGNEIKTRNFKGVTAIGDIHAMREALKSAITWATARSHFIIFLGDTIDYGPKPLECISDIYDIVMAGRGALVYGNHERKIDKWIEQDRKGDIRVRIGEGNQITIDAIKRLTKWQRDIFEYRFKALMCTARHAYQINNILFTHGASDPAMFNSNEFRFKDRTLSSLAMFGEIDSKEPMKNGYPNRIYNWVDTIPNDNIVVVGHDIRSTEKPLIQDGKLGGTAVFLDTGSGKGGSLTSADIRFSANKHLKVNNFRRH